MALKRPLGTEGVKVKNKFFPDNSLFKSSVLCPQKALPIDTIIRLIKSVTVPLSLGIVILQEGGMPILE